MTNNPVPIPHIVDLTPNLNDFTRYFMARYSRITRNPPRGAFHDDNGQSHARGPDANQCIGRTDTGFIDLFEYYRDRQYVVDRDPSPEAQAAHIWGSYVEPAIVAAGEKPVFGVVHEIDPHSPYQAPEPYASLYDFGYEGNNQGDWDEFRKTLPDLLSEGWAATGATLTASNGRIWDVLQKDVHAGELYTIRTNKYSTPLLIIPEPATLGLLMIGGLVLLRLRR